MSEPKCTNAECTAFRPNLPQHCAAGGDLTQCELYRDHVPDATEMVRCGNTDGDIDCYRVCRFRSGILDNCQLTKDQRRICGASESGSIADCTLAAIAGHVEHPAVAELANLRRTLELTGHVLPEIDETVYEYSPAAASMPGEWHEAWLGSGVWTATPRCLDQSGYLMRRRRRVRRAPTDADAIEQLRRDCWVLIDNQWVEAKLLMVADGVKNPYLVIRTESSVGWYQQCEIEVEA
jgi:hypothetical protein